MFMLETYRFLLSCSFDRNGPLLVHSGITSAVHRSHDSSWIPLRFGVIFLLVVEVYYVAVCSHGLSILIYIHLFSVNFNSFNICFVICPLIT